MAKRKKGKAAAAEEASEVEESRAPEPESLDNEDDWGTWPWGTSKKDVKIKKGKATAAIVEGKSKAEDIPVAEPEAAAGRASEALPFDTVLGPARRRIFLRGISPVTLDRRRRGSGKSSRSPSLASSLILQPRDTSSERENASVKTNPHPWDSSSNASRPSKPQLTRSRVGSVSSSTSNDNSLPADEKSLSASISAAYSDNSWEEDYSDDIAPSASASRPHSAVVEEPTSEGSLHVGDGNTTQRDGAWSPHGTDIRPPPVYFPPGTNTGDHYPGHHPGYNYPILSNPFVPYEPPPSPSIPGPPPSSSENLNIDSQSLFTCTIGMMLIGYDLKFFPRTCTLDGETSLLKYMATAGLSALRGPAMMIVDDWKPWYLQHLQKAFPRFPAKMPPSFHDQGVLSELPFANESHHLTCITEHISTDPRASKSDESDHVIPLGSTQAIFRSTFTWTTKDAMAQSPPPQSDMHYHEQGSTSLIVIVNGSKKAISQKIIYYYLKSDPGLERWKRLADNPEWTYMDTHFLFTKWDRVWAAVKRNLQDRISESQGLKPSGPILQQTQRLHQDANTMMSLLEHLRIHQTALERFSQEITNGPGTLEIPGRYKLHQRINRTHLLLSYYDMMATSMIGQQQNLLGLAFNVETVMQGQAVGRLNALAFIFLPMSFAASVFGMTTFTMDAK